MLKAKQNTHADSRKRFPSEHSSSVQCRLYEKAFVVSSEEKERAQFIDKSELTAENIDTESDFQ